MKISFRVFQIITVCLMIPIVCHAFDKWPDTGQIDSYTDTVGEDSDYTINPPSYTKLGVNGVVLLDGAAIESGWIMTRDNVTGLIWEVKTDDGSIHDKNNKYTWCDSNIDNPGTCGEGTDTEDFIHKLNSESFGGFDDWRLPTIKELSSIAKTGRHSPTINTHFFPNIGLLPDYYWSSTSYTNNYHVWQVYFYNFGFISTKPKSNQGYVFAVRGPKSNEPALIDNGDTVTDTKTGLMWLKESHGTVDWEAAINYCETLSSANHDDWRLPNRNELQSLVDYSKSKPAIDTALFPDTHSSNYWSSTTQAFLTTQAWFVNFDSGLLDYYDKSDTFYSYYVRPVRGGLPASLKDSFIGLKVMTSYQTTTDLSGDVNGNNKIDLLESIYILQKITRRIE